MIVDDLLPLRENNGESETLFAGIGPDSALWVPILEKAFAKYQGNYAHIVGGDPRWAVRTLTGAPYDMDSHGNDDTIDALWNRVLAHNAAGDILMAGTPNGSDTTTNSDGLVQGHAYNILDLLVLSNGQRLVKMQNPWSSETYRGDWSDESSLWTS